MLESVIRNCLIVSVIAEPLLGLEQNVIDDLRVRGHTGSGGNQRRIRGRILRLNLLDGLDIAGVGDYGCHLAELFEQRCHG
jgi:hypothetical protein